MPIAPPVITMFTKRDNLTALERFLKSLSLQVAFLAEKNTLLELFIFPRLGQYTAIRFFHNLRLSLLHSPDPGTRVFIWKPEVASETCRLP